MKYSKSFAIALSTVAAQIAVDANAQALEEVVVTAQRRVQNLQDVPIAVNAIGADMLEQNSIQSISELARIAPGLSIDNKRGDPAPAIGIRGITTSILNIGVEASAAVYIDGIYQRDATAVSLLFDVQQIEVLKGPQGTLFGRNAAAGAINIKTNPPEEGTSGRAVLSAGNEDLRRVSGVLNLPVNDDLLTRTSMTVRKRDGWQTDTDSANTDDLYELDDLAVRSRVRWLPTDELTLDFTIDYQEEEGTRSGFVLEEWGSVIPSSGFESTQDLDSDDAGMSGLLFENGELVPYNADRSYDSTGLALSLDWQVTDDVSVTSVTSYRDSKAKTPDSTGGLYAFNEAASPYLPGHIGPETFKFESYNQEFRVNGVTDNLDWFVGFNYFNDESSLFTNLALPAFSMLGIGTGELGDALSDSEVTIDSYAVFGDVIFDLSERWNLAVGARYSYDEKEITWSDVTQGAPDVFFAEIQDGAIVATGMRAVSDDDWDNISGRLVLDYQATDEVMVYGSLSQGYKSGGFNSQLNPGSDPNDNFDKETSLSYEAGFKSTLVDGKLVFNGAIFFVDYSDYQFQVAAPGAIAAVNLGGDAEVKGGELELTYQPTENLSFSAKTSFLDGEFTEDVSATGPGGTATAVKDGQEMMRAPDFAGVVTTDYYLDLSGGSSLRFNLTYSYTDSFRISNTNIETLQGNGIVFVEDDVRADDYGLLNGRISFTDSSDTWQLALWGSNLLDETYREGSRIEIASAVYGSLSTSARPYVRNEPRMYGVDLEYRF